MLFRSHHYELYDHIGKEENFPSCFPSESTLRNTITNQAAEDLVLLSHDLTDKYIFIGCDKGKCIWSLCLGDSSIVFMN